uniref:Uncharacterized protein n=1 Tax=Tanacetum cinerariifolium TaxID=118510 RepID=A0A6L2KEV3_TANCI|nr:hypothetical protein [Tanacetum cinerariifolium]
MNINWKFLRGVTTSISLTKQRQASSHSPVTQVSDSDSSSPSLKRFNNTLSLIERQLVKYLRKVSRVLFHRINEEQWAQHEKVDISYAELKASIEGYYKENVNHKEQTDKLIQATMESLDKTTTERVNLLNALNGVTKTLKVVQDDVKDDPALNKKAIEAIEAYSKNLSALTKLLSLVKNFEMTAVESSQADIRSDISSLKQDTSKIKSMMTGIYQAFKGEKFKKAQDAEDKVLKRQHTKKVKRLTELNKERVKQYIWTMSNRLNPEPIIDVKIHPNSKPAVLTVYRNNDKKNFDVHNLFNFGDFGITELDELGLIIEKKNNFIVKDLMTSLGKRYERLKKIPEELRIQSTFPAPIPQQASSQSLGRKSKHMELAPEVKVPGLECNRSLPEGVPILNNMVIEEPVYGIFFTDVFGDQPFQRWNDIYKVRVDSMVSYLVMALTIKTLKNA